MQRGMRAYARALETQCRKPIFPLQMLCWHGVHALLGHPVADLVGVRDVQMHPPLVASNGFLHT